jgi:hypothetical protein
MTSKYMDEAEDANQSFALKTKTLEVDGGKLYITTAHAGENSEAISVAQTFVPTPEPSKVIPISDEACRQLASFKDVASVRWFLAGLLAPHGLKVEA